jgi:hypothetical protein
MPLDLACGCISGSLGLVAIAVAFTKEKDGAEISNGDGELAYRTSMVGGTEVIANDIDEKGGLDATVSVSADISDGSDKGEQGSNAEDGRNESSEGDIPAWQGYQFEGQGYGAISIEGELNAEDETEYGYEDSYEGSTYGYNWQGYEFEGQGYEDSSTERASAADEYGYEDSYEGSAYGYNWQGHQLEGQGYEDSSIEGESSPAVEYGFEDSYEDSTYGYDWPGDWQGHQLEGQGYEDSSIEGESSPAVEYGYEDSYEGSAYNYDWQGYRLEGRGYDDSSIEGEGSAEDGFGYKDEGSAYGFENYYDYYEDETTGEHTTKCVWPHTCYMATYIRHRNNTKCIMIVLDTKYTPRAHTHTGASTIRIQGHPAPPRAFDAPLPTRLVPRASINFTHTRTSPHSLAVI